jgi:hypothetical protein
MNPPPLRPLKLSATTKALAADFIRSLFEDYDDTDTRTDESCFLCSRATSIGIAVRLKTIKGKARPVCSTCTSSFSRVAMLSRWMDESGCRKELTNANDNELAIFLSTRLARVSQQLRVPT